MKLTVIIPMYNEASIVSTTAETLCGYLENWAAATDNTWEVLFSDDGSHDDCGRLVQTYADTHTHRNGTLVLVSADKNYGKGHAITLAMGKATGDFVMYTDCDLAYGVDVLGKAVQLWQEYSCDVLIGSRNLDKNGYAGYTFLRKLASRVYIKVLCLVAGFKMSDSQCGCKGFAREMGQAVFAENQTWGWAFDIEILLRAIRKGADIREMAVQVINHRESKIHLVRDSIRMMRDILKIRRQLRLEEHE